MYIRSEQRFLYQPSGFGMNGYRYQVLVRFSCVCQGRSSVVGPRHRGQKIEGKNDELNFVENKQIQNDEPNNLIIKTKDQPQIKTPKRNFTPINSYKPSGNLVYDDELLFKIEGKLTQFL